MKSKWLISVGLVVCLVMTFALPMCAPAPAPPVEEEKPPVEEEAPPVVEEEEELAPYITAYMADGAEVFAVISGYIKEELGVDMRYSFLSCGEIGARMRAEAPYFAVDFVSACGPQAYLAKEEGWAVAYDSPNWRGAGDLWVDPDNYWWNRDCFSFILDANKDMLAESGYAMPESWDELLDPKWKGQITMPSPTSSGTAFMMLYSFMTLYGFNEGKGEEGGWEYLEALDTNIHHYVKSGSAPLDLCGRGEFILGISSDSNVLNRMESGLPITWTIPKEGTGYSSHNFFIVKGTKQEYTCQKIVDLLGTKGFAAELAAMKGVVTKWGADVPCAFYEGAIYPPERPFAVVGMPAYIPNIDLAWANANKARLLSEWEKRIGRAVE